MANEGSYVVGKGKPPVHSRFRKGQSGNPNGRRKGSKNLATRVKELLNGKIPVIENGHRKKISMLDAILKQQAKKALSGDHRATILLFQLTDNDPIVISEKTKAELQAEGARRLDLFYNAYKILYDLGVRMPVIKSDEQPAIDVLVAETVPGRVENDAVAIKSAPVEDVPLSREPLPAPVDSSNPNVSPEHDEGKSTDQSRAVRSAIPPWGKS